MWIQDALGMDTYQLNSAAGRGAARTGRGTPGGQRRRGQCGRGRHTGRLEQRRPHPGGPQRHCGPFWRARRSGNLTTLEPGLTPGFRTVASAIAANPTAALLPVQVTYYMGMLGSTPARMFMSSGSSAGSAAGVGPWRT